MAGSAPRPPTRRRDAALLRWTRLPGVAAGVLGTLAGGVLVVIAALVVLIAL
ncbi:hypothetical protein [Brachybacterium saurashtrense]|uniref:hypothetical protein n=1 Tax=Brachybacterium saurashtrense TaxID=556288 RepID=UPI0013B3F102|nr:hypothetical protein [Brachybacterium saurashtrense]